MLDHKPVERFRSAKSLALLAYLALARETTHSRAHLINLFWPDLPEDNARQNLSQTITRLRDTLGAAGNLIVTTRQDLWLDWGAKIEIDVQTFRHLLDSTAQHSHKQIASCAQCQEKLAQAVALVRGDLLLGLPIYDSVVFEEWLLLEREHIRQQMLEALTQLADGALAQGKYDSAIQYARHQVGLESWREIAHRQLIQALALNGQRNEALVQYEQCRSILEKELGVEPMRLTRQLAEAVRDGKMTDAPELLASPPQPAAMAPNNNLPHALTPFIGREAELQSILGALRGADDIGNAEPRLITITGPGGIGKTRLAQEAGQALLANPSEDWALEEVWFVSLIGVSGAQNLPVVIANTLDVPIPTQGDVGAALIQYLRSRRMLLILDNFETLLDSRPWLIDLMQSAAGMRLLVTSREPLRLLAEKRVVLRGLAVPKDHDPYTQALDYDASRLFLDRARRLFSNFRLNDENWPHIVQICRLVEGLPLGIELAVTLLEERSPADVAAQIMTDAAALTTDYLDIAPHQRSIHLVFEQSWARLSPAEQRILSRMSIFESNGFNQAAALEVAGAQPHHIHALVRKSLVQMQSDGWYALHPLFKLFAARKLPGDIKAVTELRRTHADFFAKLLEEAVPLVFDKQKHLKIRNLLLMLLDFRAGWQWLISTGDAALIMAMDGPLYRLLRETAQLREGREWYEAAWEHLEDVWKVNSRTHLQEIALAQISAHLGFFRLFCGDIVGARPCLENALTEFDRLGITEGRGEALAALSDSLRQLGEYEIRVILWENELASIEADAAKMNPLYQNQALGNLGEALYHMGRWEEAREVLMRTLTTGPENKPDYDIAITISNLGLAEILLGNFAQAREYLEQSLQIRQQYANTYRIGSAWRALGLLALAEQNYVQAQQRLQKAMEFFVNSGRRDGMGEVYVGLARAAMGVGNWDTALQQIRKALAHAEELKSVAQGLNGLWVWGEYLWRVGQHDEALVVLSFVLHHKHASGFLVRGMRVFFAAYNIDEEKLTLHKVDPQVDVDWVWWAKKIL